MTIQTPDVKPRSKSLTIILNSLHILGWVIGLILSPEVQEVFRSGGWAAVATSVANLVLREKTTKGVEGWK